MADPAHTSKAFSLDRNDVLKLLKSLLIAASGAIIAAITAKLGSLDSGTTQGAIIAAVGSLGINAFRKWVADNGGSATPSGGTQARPFCPEGTSCRRPSQPPSARPSSPPPVPPVEQPPEPDSSSES